MRVAGFYKARVYAILAQSPLPLTAKQVWSIFEARFHHEIKSLPGKSKKATIEAVLSRFATHQIVFRTQHQNTCWRYYAKWKTIPESVLQEEEDILIKQQIAAGSLVSIARTHGQRHLHRLHDTTSTC